MPGSVQLFGRRKGAKVREAWLGIEKPVLKACIYALVPEVLRENTIARGRHSLCVAVPLCNAILLREASH